MVQISRAALCLVATCYAAVSSLALAATQDNTTTPPTATTTNATAPAKEKASIRMLNNDCRITFTYWDRDNSPTFDIKFVHTNGVDDTTEYFDGGDMPIRSSNTEAISGDLRLVQIYPRQQMVCISHIQLECNYDVSGYGAYKSVTVNADAIQESWIRRTGQRKPVNWAHGPCLYFRGASYDTGAFRALDIYRDAFECGDDYMCTAGRIEPFGN